MCEQRVTISSDNVIIRELMKIFVRQMCKYEFSHNGSFSWRELLQDELEKTMDTTCGMALQTA